MFSWQSSQEAPASNDAKEEKYAEKEEKETKDAAESSSSSSAEGFGCHGRFDLDYFKVVGTRLTLNYPGQKM